MSALCPRCRARLVPAYGHLGEDRCAQCGGCVLSPELTKRVLLDEVGLDPAVVRELAREHSGGERLSCPSCDKPMSPVTLKATAVDICLPCGTTFLDAGELARLSGGRHGEHAPPPSRVRPVDLQPRVEEAPPDPRATWEKAFPAYALQTAALWMFLLARGYVGDPLKAAGVAIGIVSIPLGLSMFVDVDLRGLFRGRRTFGRYGHHHGNAFLGGLMLFLGILVGGVLSTLNASLAERFPRVLSTKVGLAVLALLLLVAGAMSLRG